MMKKESREVMKVGDQQPPHDIYREQAVLATLMRYNDKYMEYCDLLNTDLFYQQREKAMFRCIAGVISAGHITDVNSLSSYAQEKEKESGLSRDSFLEIYGCCNTRTIGQDVDHLRDLAKRRICWMMLYRMSQRMLDVTLDVNDEVNDAINSLGEVQVRMGESGLKSYASSLEGVRRVIDDNIKGRGQFLPTGFGLFDKYYLLKPGSLTVLAAFTGVGKSSLAMNIAVNVASKGVPVAYYSLEMSKEELASRGISKEVGLPASVIMNNPLADKWVEKVDMVVGRYKGLPLYFDDSCSASFDKTIRSIRMEVKTKGIRLAIIDYLQIYAQVGESSEESIAYMARAAKNVAKETGVAVIVLSQLRRGGSHPTMSSLRGSGQIEESADNVVLIDRPEASQEKNPKYEGEFSDYSVKDTAKLMLVKGRGVGTGCSILSFDKKHTLFKDLVCTGSSEPYREQKDDLPF